MKDPVKLARKELPKYGAEIVSDRGFLVELAMPRGGRLIVDRKSKLARIREIVEQTRADANPLRGYMSCDVEDAPSGLWRRVSKHFMERFELMAEQEQLTHGEVAAALDHPVRVWRAGARWAFERGRVIVIGEASRTQLVLVTPLWAEESLWARNPRPEKEEPC